MKMGTTAGGIHFLLREEEKFRFCLIKCEMRHGVGSSIYDLELKRQLKM